MLKHVGKLAATDSKCVVVMMQIPGNESHALICESDSLPDRLHQVVMDVVESKEGQAAQNLSEAMHRRYDSESGQDILNTLHNHGRLRAVPVDQVYMVPAPGRVYPLNEIIRNMQILNGDTTAQILNPSQHGDPNNPRYNPHLENMNASSREELEGSAKSLLTQAELMMHDAYKLRERAYTMAPSLRPKREQSERMPSVEPKKEVLAEERVGEKQSVAKPALNDQEVMAMYSNAVENITEEAPKKTTRRTSSTKAKSTSTTSNRGRRKKAE